MRDHLTRRPIPIEQSILWKPLHDSHYVVASLQSGDGGRRKIFVRQEVLRRVLAGARAHGRRSLGILLGQLYQCSESATDYLVVESVDNQNPVRDESEVAATIAEALAARSSEHHIHFPGTEHRAEVVGWYHGVPTVEAKPSITTAGVHASLFSQPWQISLVVGEGAEGSSGGAIFLHDTVNSRWFYAPFYELLSATPAPHQPKPTLVSWPQYLTADTVVPAATELVSSVELADERPKTPYERPWLRRSTAKKNDATDARIRDVAEVPLVAPPQSQTQPPAAVSPLRGLQDSSDDATDPAVIDLRAAPVADRPASDQVSDRPAQRSSHSGLADVPRTSRERPIARRADRPEKLSIIDDRDQRSLGSSSKRRVSDDDDTTVGDDPGRFIELARSEGFFIASRFDAKGDGSRAEVLWILNEPYSGLLLAVVATASEIVDATLHYNLQTDDAGLQRTPFPEHRDIESKVIYVRETCVDSLRARCRRLRAGNSLLREWKVAPTISFLTPGEWESVASFDGGLARGTDTISQLNNSRIAELPEGVRSQFHLGGGSASDAGSANGTTASGPSEASA